MVARIKIGASLSRSFFYNENKVKDGVANCLMAQNFPFDQEQMNAVQRLNVLQKAASLRESLKASTVHISLNFDPSEQLSQDKLKNIATAYMEKIGFGMQPYLVYEHQDSGHPHIHILTTKVDWNGKAINTNFIARDRSEPARKELEIMFDLVKAEGSKKTNKPIKSAYVQKVNYGKTESKKAIETVLNEVINNYRFTSVPELNAVLNLYNVKADKGTENSRTFKNNGLHYKIIDANGNAVGVPIKASLFAEKPTLKFLENQFKKNDPLRLPHKSRIKNTIDFYFLKKKGLNLDDLIKALTKDGIQTILRRNESGVLYGMTYVDHKTKCVFNGSALGKQYSANGIQERLQKEQFNLNMDRKNEKVSRTDKFKINEQYPEAGSESKGGVSLIDDLMGAENNSSNVPYEFSGKKKKRRKRKSK